VKPCLTFHRIVIIRTSGISDAVLARRWRVSVATIRNARIGLTWRDHPVPPDKAPRAHKGNWND
jgi:hypothetical protein